MRNELIAFCAAALFHSTIAFAADEVICLYKAADGGMRQVNALSAIPPEFRSQAKCFSKSKREPQMAKPEEIELKGNLRSQNMVSPVGNIELRWPRAVERLFGRTPERAMADAAATLSRALKKGGFPYDVQTLNLEWKVVFMDETLPSAQIPATLVSNCHPGWMTPPANIYIASQRVAAGCGSSQRVNTGVADGQLARVLLHEMGHAVEFHLLGPGQTFDRMRAEGFASWFEQYSADLSAVIPRGEVRKEFLELARRALKRAPDYFEFKGSAEDYARASLYFSAIADRRGVSALMKVYDFMRTNGSDIFSAVSKTLMWNRQQLEKEAQKIAGVKE